MILNHEVILDLPMAATRTIREVEVKIRIENLAGLIGRLGKMRVCCEGRVFEQNTVYDTPDGAYRRKGRLLRLRTETPAPGKAVGVLGGGRKAVFTSKAAAPGSRSAYKERLEREVPVRSPAQWPARLCALGLGAGFCYQKYRTLFCLPGLHLDLDETPIGTFLELEGAPQAIDRAARALGFSSRHYIRGTYWSLFQASRRGRARARKNMTFRA